jgi:hypothetical protein
LRWLIRHAIEAIDDGIGFGGFASLLTEDDPEFSTVFRQVLVAHRAKLASVIEACKADGTMRVDIDPETLIDAIVGAYIAERARKGQVGDDWEDRLFTVFWSAVRTYSLPRLTVGTRAHTLRRWPTSSTPADMCRFRSVL